MRAILYTLGFVAIVAGPFWLSGKHHAVGEIPAEFRSEVAPEVLAWEVTFGTNDQPVSKLGPLSPRLPVDMASMQLLGPPSDHFTATALRSDDGTRAIAYPGLGLQIEGFGDFHSRTPPLQPDQGSQREARLVRVILGNPWAMSADDPIVKACPFKMPNGIAFGMGIEEIERRLREISPSLVPGTYKQGYNAWISREDGVTVTMSYGVFHYKANQLVGIVLE